MKSIYSIPCLLLTVAIVGGCSGSGGGSGSSADGVGDRSVATRTSVLPDPDADCASGGILVETGIDENANGLLDSGEVDHAEKVCNGTDGDDGLDALVLITPESIGTNCAAGGWKIDSGIDLDSDAVLDAAEITSTAYVCNASAGRANWRGMETISSISSIDADNPQVAINGDGDGLSVWNQPQVLAGVQDIWAARFDSVFGWEAPVTIETDDSGDALFPQVVVDPEGNATVAWHQHDGNRYNVWYNRYDAVNQTWTGATLLESIDAGDAWGARLAVDGSGNVYAGWNQSNGQYLQPRGRFYDIDLQGWTAAFDLNTDNLGDAIMYDVEFDAAGNAIFVWYESDGSRENIWSFYTPAGNNAGSAEMAEDIDTGGAFAPRVVFDSQGEAIVVWAQQDSGRLDVWTNRYLPGSGWGSVSLMELDDSGDAGDVSIAIDAADHILVSWSQDNGSVASIFVNEYFPATGWSGAELIEKSNSTDANFPALAMSASGEAVVVWRQFSSGNGNDILANRLDPFDGWEVEQYIELQQDGDALEPQVAMNAGGDMLAVWKQRTGLGGQSFTIRSNRIVR